MPTIRQRLTNFFLGDEKRKLEATTRALWEAYQDGPYNLPPTELIRQLTEYDSAVLEDLALQLQWEKLGMLGYGAQDASERQRLVLESQRLYKYSPLAQWAVWTWTNFGFGDEVLITCEDEQAQEVFSATWDNSQIFANDRIHELSNAVLVDGSVFMVAYESMLDGSVRFSTIPQDEIVEIVTNPKDNMQPLFYKRQWTTRANVTKIMYYPDWQVLNNEDVLSLAELPQNAIRADKQNEMNGELEQGEPATIAYILHIAHNRKDSKLLYGWPILGIAAPYARAHKQFVENRLTVSAQKASFVREFITGGGSRAVDAIKTKMASTLSQTNYVDQNPPSAGGNLIHNKTVEHRDLPMSTGASDAAADNEMFSWMALLGMGMFPTSAGLDTSRWATALAMDKTQSMLWSRYQTFWAAQFKRIVEITLDAYERHNDGVTFSSHDCDVSIDSLNLVDFPDIVSSMSGLLSSAFAPFVGTIIPPETAKGILAEVWRLALQALGVTNADDLTSDEAFGIGAPEQAAENALLSAIRALSAGEIEMSEFAGFVKDALCTE